MANKILPVFTHIPKTAGTTLNRVLAEQYVFKPGLTYAGGGIPYIDKFISLPARDKWKIKLIKEHFHFGIHRYCPFPVRYFTMLRDPQKRAISQFHHMQRLYKLYPQYRKLRLDKYSLRDFLEKGIVDEMDNCHVRFLCDDQNIPYGGVTAEHLQQAIHNLQTNYLVGITERFTESVLLFARNLGWSDPYYVKGNISPISADDTVIDSETRQLLSNYNRFDNELYKAGLSIFEKQVADAGPGFPHEVHDFLQRNEQRKFRTIVAVHLISKLRYLNKHHLWNLQHTIAEHFRAR